MNQVIKSFTKFKPAEGVEFTQYDRYGFPMKADGNYDVNDYRRYLAKDDGDNDGFEFVAPPDEQMSKILEIQQALIFQGGRKDVDKKVEEMNQEERAVFDCLEDENNINAENYEELDDDFLLMLNDGKPALEKVTIHEQIPVQKPEEKKAAEEFEHPMMIPNYKEKMADVIAMLDKQNEIRKNAQENKDMKEAQQMEKMAKKAVDQKALDEVFGAFMQREYKDEQIGELENEVIDPLAFIEGEENRHGEEPDEFEYGELSDGECPSNAGPSNADIMEQRQIEDSNMINQAVDEFI